MFVVVVCLSENLCIANLSSFQHDEASKAGIDKINALLESFMGINDTELATQMWDLANGKTNSMQLADAIDNSDLQEFGFTDEFIIELWGVITDARSGRLY